jgi:uncharacterized protein YceH (UPF0502 family)
VAPGRRDGPRLRGSRRGSRDVAAREQLIQRVAQLETEIAALRRTLKQLKRENRGDGEVEAA